MNSIVNAAPSAPAPGRPSKGANRIAPLLALFELVMDQYRLHQATKAGEVPREAYWSETAGNVGKAAGGLGGARGGAAMGTAIFPGVGTALGALIGGAAGSSLGRSGAKWLNARLRALCGTAFGAVETSED